MRAERMANHARGDVHNLDHALVRHAGGANHPQCAYYLPIDSVWRTDHGKLLQRRGLVLAPDIDANARGLAGFI